MIIRRASAVRLTGANCWDSGGCSWAHGYAEQPSSASRERLVLQFVGSSSLMLTTQKLIPSLILAAMFAATQAVAEEAKEPYGTKESRTFGTEKIVSHALRLCAPLSPRRSAAHSYSKTVF